MSRTKDTQNALDLMEEALAKMTQSVDELRTVVVALKEGDMVIEAEKRGREQKFVDAAQQVVDADQLRKDNAD